MRTFLVLCLHLTVSVAKLVGPGGTRGLLAETLLLKHPLLVIDRARRKDVLRRALAKYYRPGPGG